MNNTNINNAIAAFNSEVVSSKEEAKNLEEALKSPDIEVQEKALAVLAQKSADFRNAIYGKPVSNATEKSAREGVTFKHDQLYKPTSTTAYTYNTLSNALNLDFNWMQFFQMVPSFDGAEIDLETITNILEFSEYLDGEELKPKPLASLAQEKIRTKRWGVAVDFLNRWLKNNGYLTIQQITQRILVAEQKKKASIAYTQLADTSGITVEAYATSIENTINNGINNMIDGMLAANSAFDVVDDSTVLLLSHSKNKPAISARLNALRGSDGTNIISEYNVQPVYTRNTNVLSDLGIGGAPAAMLVFPGVANVWGDFEALKIEQMRRPSVDGSTLYAQSYFNSQTKAIQKRVVMLS